MNLTWEMLYGVGAIALLCALVYGMVQYKTRNRANDRITEEATREEYAHPDTYAQKREELKKELRPS